MSIRIRLYALLAVAALPLAAHGAGDAPAAPGAPMVSQVDALRLPTPDERVYLAIAWDTGLAAVCERISPQAYEEWSFNPRGKQIALTRSRCYMGVAENTRDVALCERVLALSRDWRDGSYYSAETCRTTAAGAPDTKRSWPRKRALQGVMEQLGYTLDDLLRRCGTYLEERGAWLRSRAGESLRAEIGASPHPDLLDEFLFGPHHVSDYDRPHRFCKLFFEVEYRAEPFEIGFTVKDRAALERAYEEDIYDIYRTVANTPEFRERISAVQGP